MNKSKIFVIIAAFQALFLLSSCGESSLGGGVGEFTRVTVVASANTPRLEADVNTGNTCSATGVLTEGSYVTETVDVVVKSTAYPNMTGLPVVIDKITISYAPANSVTPALANVIVSTLGTTVAPGGSITIPVPVAKDIVKYSLVKEKNLQLCSNMYYEYYVTIALEGLEVGTGERSVILTSLNVAFADRAE